MIEGWLFVLTLVAALGCGLTAGVFFAFSTFVMRALGRLPPAQGIAAMQAINVAAITPLFMTALFGTGALCVVAAVAALLLRSGPSAAWLFAGSAIYLAGAIAVTMACNVPRNNALARVAPDSADGARLWTGYVAGWTGWNHVRTVACLAAAAALTMALR